MEPAGRGTRKTAKSTYLRTNKRLEDCRKRIFGIVGDASDSPARHSREIRANPVIIWSFNRDTRMSNKRLRLMLGGHFSELSVICSEIQFTATSFSSKFYWYGRENGRHGFSR